MTRRSAFVVAGACLVLLLAWYFLLWSPKGRDLAAASERVEAAEHLGDELEVRLARLQSSKDRAPELAATYDRLRTAVPDSPGLAQFILDANDAATRAGVDFLSITPSQPAPSTTPGVATEIKLSLTVEGGYFQTLTYLDHLLALPRIVVLDSVQVTPKGDNGDLVISLLGRMFSQERAGVAAGAAPAPGAATTAPTAPETVASPPTTNVAVTR